MRSFYTYTTLVVTSCLWTAQATQASELTKTRAFDAALGARDALITRFNNTDGSAAAAHIARQATRLVVQNSIFALRTEGQHATANRVEREWNEQQSQNLERLTLAAELDALGVDAKDLGDHKPLSQWLGNLYETLRTRLGSAAIRQGILGDIYAVNHAIPVVIAPKTGVWRQTQREEGYGEDRDWVEYRKHFIPLMNVVTYYAASIACKYYARQSGMPDNMCNQAAGELRRVMGRYIAPKISDFVFKTANRQPARLEITQADLHYTSASELARAIGQ